MQVRTKKHPIKEVHFTGRPETIARLRQLARELGAAETTGNLAIEDVFPELRQNRSGVSLRGLRSREGLTQAQLSELSGVPQRHISEMESGKRPIGKENARKLAGVLNADDRALL